MEGRSVKFHNTATRVSSEHVCPFRIYYLLREAASRPRMSSHHHDWQPKLCIEIVPVPVGVRDEQWTSSRGDAQRCICPYLRCNAQTVGGCWPALSRVGDIPSEGISR